MFIKYKDQKPVNMSLVNCIALDVDIFSKSPEIQFCSDNRTCFWQFSTKEERDEVYKKVLKMIEVKEIV